VSALFLTIKRCKINARIADQEATTRREAPIIDSYPDLDDEFDPEVANCPRLTIIATFQGRFVYCQGSELAKLLNNARLVIYLQDLPYQPGDLFPLSRRKE